KSGATLRYLPKYSPDLNPIEMPYSKFKTFLRKVAARTVPGLNRAIRAFIPQLSPQECANYFRRNKAFRQAAREVRTIERLRPGSREYASGPKIEGSSTSSAEIFWAKIIALHERLRGSQPSATQSANAYSRAVASPPANREPPSSSSSPSASKSAPPSSAARVQRYRLREEDAPEPSTQPDGPAPIIGVYVGRQGPELIPDDEFPVCY